MLTQFQDDLQGTDHRLASGRLELISGWLRSDVSIRAAWSQAVATSEEAASDVVKLSPPREIWSWFTDLPML